MGLAGETFRFECTSIANRWNIVLSRELRHQPFKLRGGRLLRGQSGHGGQFAPPMAGGRVPGLIVDKRWLFDPATLDGVGATRVKVRAGGRGERAWNIASQRLPLPPGGRLGDGDRRKKSAGVTMSWIGEEFIGGRGLDDTAEIH